jgi:hypothetical protein
MIRMIDRYSGFVMWVHESRVDEYKARGHKLAPVAKPAKAPKKTTKK